MNTRIWNFVVLALCKFVRQKNLKKIVIEPTVLTHTGLDQLCSGETIVQWTHQMSHRDNYCTTLTPTPSTTTNNALMSIESDCRNELLQNYMSQKHLSVFKTVEGKKVFNDPLQWLKV